MFEGKASYQLWFLPAIFLYQLMSMILTDKKNKRYLSIFVSSLLLIVLTYLVLSPLFDGFSSGFENRFFYHLPFAFVGILLAISYRVGIDVQRQVTYIAIMSLLFVASSFISDQFFLFELAYGTMIFGAGLCIRLKPQKWIKLVSKSVMGIYLIHALFIESLQVLLARIGFASDSLLFVLMITVLVFILSLTTTLFLNQFKIVKRIHLFG
ncbi:acyltransferase family protein [Cerasicoccus arenae]|nr:acyltransferase family protein [Cerasicoccus arenae]